MHYLPESFNYDYISQRVRLTWREIFYGLERNYISPEDSIKHAISELSLKDDYSQELIELASLSKGQSVWPSLIKLVSSEKEQEEGTIKDKWMYLVLDWLYNNKDNYSNALELVELVYSDYEYPAQISSFVRYMPSCEPDLGSKELHENRLLEKWKQYLDHEQERFS